MDDKSLEQLIREHAYFLWEQDGCPEGRADEYWQRAAVSLENGDSPTVPGITDARAPIKPEAGSNNNAGLKADAARNSEAKIATKAVSKPGTP